MKTTVEPKFELKEVKSKFVPKHEYLSINLYSKLLRGTGRVYKTYAEINIPGFVQFNIPQSNERSAYSAKLAIRELIEYLLRSDFMKLESEKLISFRLFLKDELKLLY